LTGVAPFVNFVGALTGSSAGDQLNFTTNPTLTNGILPYATVTNGANYDFATLATNSLAAFASYNATTLGAVTGSNTAVVKLTANDATIPAAGVAPYAVIVQGNATVTGAGTLTTSTLALGGTDNPQPARERGRARNSGRQRGCDRHVRRRYQRHGPRRGRRRHDYPQQPGHVRGTHNARVGDTECR